MMNANQILVIGHGPGKALAASLKASHGAQGAPAPVVVNVSPDWKGSTREERRILQGVLDREATPAAIRYFAKHCSRLGDYWYWFALSTLWVSYSGHSDLKLWKRLLIAPRKGREASLMKPEELQAYLSLPEAVTAYRAHRAGEQDWISFTLNPVTAARFAVERGVTEVSEWEIPKKEIVALFLRRGEEELIVLDRRNATKVRMVPVVSTAI
jgi:hypothetical protein